MICPLFTAILFSLLAIPPAADAAVDKPHVILILADDLGSGDVRAMNPNSRIATPNLDALARSGARFTDAHSPSAVCTPTRYGILTGRYCWRSDLKSGVLWGRDPLLIEPDRPTIASALDEAGYHTAFVGKWHLGLGSEKREDWAEPFDRGPHTVGFAESIGIPSSLDIPPYCWVRDGQVESPPTDQVERSEHRRADGGGFWRKGPASPGFDFSDVLPRSVDESIRILRQHAGSRPSEPLFLYLALSAPHTPWLPLQSEVGTTPVGHYGDFVASVDAQLGRLFRTLQEIGISDETLVIFTSDNGSHWPDSDVEKWKHDGNMGFRGQKADIHEGGHRIPLLIRWPNHIEPGTTHDQTVCLTDLYETIRRTAGLNRQAVGGEDSIDLGHILGLSNDEVKAEREAIIHHSLDGMFAIRQGPWKMIEGLGSGGFTSPRRTEAVKGEPNLQLYNLQLDPTESNDVAGDHPEVIARLKILLDRYRREDRSVQPVK